MQKNMQTMFLGLLFDSHLFKIYIFNLYSYVQDSLKFFARVVLTSKLWSFNVIMMSYLQK